LSSLFNLTRNLVFENVNFYADFVKKKQTPQAVNWSIGQIQNYLVGNFVNDKFMRFNMGIDNVS